MILELFGFFFLGVFVGTIGTLIGAGGGFLLIPAFLVIFPDKKAGDLTAWSMLAVAANASSGSLAYAIRKKIHWKSAIIFSLMSMPGIWVGVAVGELVNRTAFELFFGLFMMGVSIFIIWKTVNKKKEQKESQSFQLTHKKIIVGALISFLVGILASFLGIGGGIVHVPLLIEGLKFPVHLATGTSHFILAISSITAVFEHYHLGHYVNLPYYMYLLVIGIVIGAQTGAWLSSKISSQKILITLAVALLAVSLRLLL